MIGESARSAAVVVMLSLSLLLLLSRRSRLVSREETRPRFRRRLWAAWNYLECAEARDFYCTEPVPDEGESRPPEHGIQRMNAD